MKCPQCGQDLHIFILDDKDDDMFICQVICPKHGELFYFAFVEGELVI